MFHGFVFKFVLYVVFLVLCLSCVLCFWLCSLTHVAWQQMHLAQLLVFRTPEKRDPSLYYYVPGVPVTNPCDHLLLPPTKKFSGEKACQDRPGIPSRLVCTVYQCRARNIFRCLTFFSSLYFLFKYLFNHLVLGGADSFS